MLYILLTAAAMVLTLVFTPLFLHYQRPGINLRSFVCKMICASCFVAIGFFGAAYSHNDSQFARLLILGLILSWFGDMFLHIKGKVTFVLGFLFFLSAHVSYIVCWCRTQRILFPERPLFSWLEIALIALITGAEVLNIIFIRKLQWKTPLMIPLLIYGVFLITMFVKSAFLGICLWQSGAPDVKPGVIVLIFGAFSFMLSDFAMLPLIIDEKSKNNIYLKNHNIGTYFFGQVLLALSAFFITSGV